MRKTQHPPKAAPDSLPEFVRGEVTYIILHPGQVNSINLVVNEDGGSLQAYRYLEAGCDGSGITIMGEPVTPGQLFTWFLSKRTSGKRVFVNLKLNSRGGNVGKVAEFTLEDV